MEITGKTVMVTGGAGFIGSHLVDALGKEGPNKIIAVDNYFLGSNENLTDAVERYGDRIEIVNADVTDLDVMRKIFQKNYCDVVFNLAVQPLPYSLDHPKECSDNNVEMVTTLCNLQREKLFNVLLHFSSSEAYGTARYRPMDEKHPLGPSTPYASSKAAGDLLALSYYRTFGNDVRIIRPFNNYGPRQNMGSYAGVIPLTINRILDGEQPIIYGDGEQTRDYIYVTDTARMAIEAVKRDSVKGMTINIGSGQETSILKVISTIAKLIGYEGSIRFEPPREGDVRGHIANIYLAKDVLGFAPKVDFNMGMAETVEWYVRKRGGRRA
jgi:UDP-glucose 4-epimerase